MKLLHCTACGDVIRLYPSEQPRACLCGRAKGRYVNLGVAEVSGATALVLGMANTSFLMAVGTRRATGESSDIRAWVMPVDAPLVRHVTEWVDDAD